MFDILTEVAIINQLAQLDQPTRCTCAPPGQYVLDSTLQRGVIIPAGLLSQQCPVHRKLLSVLGEKSAEETALRYGRP